LYCEVDGNGDLSGHFFYPFIILHLEDIDFFPSASLFTFIIDFNSEVFSSVPILVTNLAFHCSIDVVVFTFDPLIQVMPFGFEVVERTNCGSLVRESILKLMIRKWKLLTSEVEE